MCRLTTLQLSKYLGVTKRTVQRRAVTEGWIDEPEFGLGGVRNLYPFASLPLPTRQKIAAAIKIKHHRLGSNDAQADAQLLDLNGLDGIDNSTYIVSNPALCTDWLSQHCFARSVKADPFKTDISRKKYAKVGLLILAKLYVYYHPVDKIKGYDQFCQQYNQRKLAIKQVIYNTVYQINRSMLLRWEKRRLEQGQTYPQQNQTSELLLDAELELMAQEVLMLSPAISATQLQQHFETVFEDRPLPSLRQLTLWMEGNQ